MYLSLNELIGIHETISVNLRFLLSLPGHPDDVLIAAFGFAGLSLVVLFRDVIGHSRRAMILFAWTAGLFLLAALGDFNGRGVEEWAEVAASSALLGACAVLAVDHLTAAHSMSEDMLVAELTRVGGRGQSC